MPEVDLAFQMAPVVAGTLGGALLGIAGGKGGDLARRGERRRWIDFVFGIVVAVGSVTAVFGLVTAGMNQPSAVWLGSIGVGVVLVVLAVRTKRHLGVLRAQAPSSQIIAPGDPNKSY